MDIAFGVSGLWPGLPRGRDKTEVPLSPYLKLQHKEAPRKGLLSCLEPGTCPAQVTLMGP